MRALVRYALDNVQKICINSTKLQALREPPLTQDGGPESARINGVKPCSRPVVDVNTSLQKAFVYSHTLILVIGLVNTVGAWPVRRSSDFFAFFNCTVSVYKQSR